jgi:hypothetical protein
MFLVECIAGIQEHRLRYAIHQPQLTENKKQELQNTRLEQYYKSTVKTFALAKMGTH